MLTEVSPERVAGERVLVGGCQCGAVRYRVEDAFAYASHCHCSSCRAATGSAFKAFAGIERAKLEITDGSDGLLVVGDDRLNDARCRACGSLLFSVVRDGEYVHVALGSLVDCPSMRPTKHIFVGSKAPWFEITDDLPQFEEHATQPPAGEAIARSLKKVSAISLFVEDLQTAKSFDGLDAVCTLLRSRGVELLTGPTDRESGMRTATFTDPAGHSWEIAQELPPSEGS